MSILSSSEQKVTLGSPVRLWRLFKSPAPITTARCRYQLFASSRVRIPLPKCRKYLFHVAFTYEGTIEIWTLKVRTSMVFLL